jgi:uncharacterized protein
MSMTSDPNTPRVMREGLFTLDPPRLLGSRCRVCGELSFPSRAFCPRCDSEDFEASVALSPLGRIHTFTVIRQAPPGRVTPYTLAYVDLDDGVRVMAQVDGEADELSIGRPVKLTIRPVDRREGVDVLGYAFTPTIATESPQ